MSIKRKEINLLSLATVEPRSRSQMLEQVAEARRQLINDSRRILRRNGGEKGYVWIEDSVTPGQGYLPISFRQENSRNNLSQNSHCVAIDNSFSFSRSPSFNSFIQSDLRSIVTFRHTYVDSIADRCRF